MNPNKVETRLREIAERENKATDEMNKQRVRVAVDEISKMLPVARCYCSQGDMAEIITKHCLPESAHSRQDVPWLLALIKKQREALEHIATCGESMCNQLCSKDYIPRGRHAPDCPIEYFATARDALNFSPENL